MSPHLQAGKVLWFPGCIDNNESDNLWWNTGAMLWGSPGNMESPHAGAWSNSHSWGPSQQPVSTSRYVPVRPSHPLTAAMRYPERAHWTQPTMTSMREGDNMTTMALIISYWCLHRQVWGGLFLSNRHLQQGLDKPHAVASLFLPKVQWLQKRILMNQYNFIWLKCLKFHNLLHMSLVGPVVSHTLLGQQPQNPSARHHPWPLLEKGQSWRSRPQSNSWRITQRGQGCSLRGPLWSEDERECQRAGSLLFHQEESFNNPLTFYFFSVKG